MDMRYSDPSQGLEIKLSAGKQHLDGAEAIQLVRFRSGYAMADITRTSVQRDFVKAAFTQWASVKSVVKLPVLMGILRKNVTTDLSAANMMWLCRAILSCGVSNMGSFRLVAGNWHLHQYYNFAGRAVETVPKSLRHSCGSELT